MGYAFEPNVTEPIDATLTVPQSVLPLIPSDQCVIGLVSVADFVADFIMNALEQLHPKFYPEPFTEPKPKPGDIPVMLPVAKGFLTKADLVRLYAECGNALHRGKIQSLGLRLNQAGSFKPIGRWCELIVKLLNSHLIPMHGVDAMVRVIMHAETDGKPHATFMEYHGPMPHQ